MPVKFTVDTGADVTLLTQNTSKVLSLHCNKPDTMLQAANVSVVEQCTVEICNNGITTDAAAFVSETATVNLLGRPQIEDLKLLTFGIHSSRFDPTNEFPTAFKGLGQACLQ